MNAQQTILEYVKLFKNQVLAAWFLVFLVSCGGGNKPSGVIEDGGTDTEVTEDTSDDAPIPKDVLNDIISSIPPPIEISFLISDLGVKYDKNILSDPKKADSYNTDFKQALNLGVYSTDLGYANIYRQTQDAVYYLNAVKKMADALDIGEYFDFNTLKDLTTNGDNYDSLIQVTQVNLEQINNHLQEKNKAHLTILILTGGWLEALNTLSQNAKQSSNELLNNRIAEQKIILDQLLLLLSYFEEEYENIKELRTDLSELQKIYDNVKITFSDDSGGDDSSTPMVTDDGIVIPAPNVRSEIKFTAEDLNKITEKSGEIRKKILE